MRFLFKFLINGNIGINKKLAYKVNYNGYETIINSETIDAKKAVSFSTNFDWMNTKNISIFDISHSNGKESVNTRNLYIYNDKSFFEAGYIENYILTFVSIFFEVDDDFDIENDNEFNELKVEISEVLKYFVSTYRVITDNYSVNIPDTERIIGLEIFNVLKESQNEIPTNESVIEIQEESDAKVTQVNAAIRSIKADMYIPEAHKNGHLIAAPNHIVMEKLIKLLQEGDSPSLAEILLMKAKEELLIKDNYLMTIIISETAFEVYVQNLLMELCELQKITQLPIGKNEHMKEYKEAIVNGNIKETLIKKYLKDIIGINIASFREYTLWHEHTYDARNNIVHKGNLKILKSEAELAFNSSLNLIKKIGEEIEVYYRTIA